MPELDLSQLTAAIVGAVLTGLFSLASVMLAWWLQRERQPMTRVKAMKNRAGRATFLSGMVGLVFGGITMWLSVQINFATLDQTARERAVWFGSLLCILVPVTFGVSAILSRIGSRLVDDLTANFPPDQDTSRN